jgi:putative ABC transport system ATP-binding protein
VAVALAGDGRAHVDLGRNALAVTTIWLRPCALHQRRRAARGRRESTGEEGVELAGAVERGELVAIIGPSGSGKTTLLAAIGLIGAPSSGWIEIDGEEIYDDGWVGPDPALVRRRKIGFIFQHHNLIPFLTVAENVRVALDLNGTRGRAAATKVSELLAYLQIERRARSYPDRISGGERQRVAIARALANDPLLILADEPTAALDTERGTSVMDHLRRLARERGAAVITVTHDERMIGGFDRIGRVQDGQLLVTPATVTP